MLNDVTYFPKLEGGAIKQLVSRPYQGVGLFDNCETGACIGDGKA